MSKNIKDNVYVVPEYKSENDPLPMLKIINYSSHIIKITNTYTIAEDNTWLNPTFLQNLIGLTLAPKSTFRFVFVGDDMMNPPADKFTFKLEVNYDYLLDFDIDFTFRNMFVKYTVGNHSIVVYEKHSNDAAITKLFADQDTDSKEDMAKMIAVINKAKANGEI